MSNVRCVMMQKNERNLLEPWIIYYGNMFSYCNIYILDNGSDDENVKLILDKYKKRGINVIYDYNSKKDFENKGDIIKSISEDWDKNSEDYDFLLPIDCDEFIIFSDGNEISLNKQKIHNYLHSLEKSHDVFIISRDYINDPAMGGLFYPTIVPKSLFPRGNIGNIDHGFHHPAPKHPDGKAKNINLGYLHFHHKPFQDVIYHAREKLSLFVDVDNREELKNYNGNGLHLTKYFFMNEEDYKNQLSDKGKIYICEIMRLLAHLGIDKKNIFGKNSIINELPINNYGYWLVIPNENNSVTVGVFNCDFYLKNHLDVTSANIDPLVHFCEFGFGENRFFNESKKSFLCTKNFLFGVSISDSPFEVGSYYTKGRSD